MQRPDAASGFKGRDSPLIDGCRESEVSCECLTGDTVSWLWNGFNALEEPTAGGMQRERAAGSLAKIGVVLPHTSCVSHYKFTTVRKLWVFFYEGIVPKIVNAMRRLPSEVFVANVGKFTN